LPGYASPKQTNYFAANGLTLTTNDWWSAQVGTRTALNQEDLVSLGGGGIDNHSMYKLTDLLALGAVLEKLDNTLSFATLNTLITRVRQLRA
jgi:hypothetical protein